MKKYFVVETDEPVEYGDSITVSLFKEIEGGTVTVEKDIAFNEQTQGWLVEMGYVEEREANEDNLLDFDDSAPCKALEGLVDKVGELEERIEKLESMESLVKTIHATVLNIQKALKKK